MSPAWRRRLEAALTPVQRYMLRFVEDVFAAYTAQQEAASSTLSGGWRMRLALARALSHLAIWARGRGGKRSGAGEMGNGMAPATGSEPSSSRA